MWIMALSGFGVPFGFRAVFAEIINPTAVGHYLQTGQNPGWMPHANPLFWTLYFHTVAAVISAGGFAAAALEKDVRGVKAGLTLGFGFLAAQLAFGSLYWYSLGQYSPLLFDAVNTTYGPLFGVKIVAVAALLVLGYMAPKSAKAGAIHPATKWLAPLELFAVVAGEVLNDGARYPNMVLASDEGLLATLFEWKSQCPPSTSSWRF
jgi:cytochrome d ubiquinol oxidase subunit I